MKDQIVKSEILSANRSGLPWLVLWSTSWELLLRARCGRCDPLQFTGGQTGSPDLAASSGTVSLALWEREVPRPIR